MRSQVSVGYLTANGEHIIPGPWSIGLADGSEASDGRLPNWDYFTDVLITRTVEVNLPALLVQTGLSGDAEVSAVLLWHSTGTNLRGGFQPVRLTGGIADVVGRLVGAELGGRLNLELRIMLSRRGSADHALAPRRIGNVVWSDNYQVDLEGFGARFPVLPVDFAKTGVAGGRRGAWLLAVSGEDLTASALGNMCLYLNSEHPKIALVLAAPDATSAQQYVAMIRYDVARQLLQYALQHQDFNLENDYDLDSVGHVLQQIVAQFPHPIDELRARLAEEPGDLEAEFQAVSGLVD